jgi:hypothetical protein
VRKEVLCDESKNSEVYRVADSQYHRIRGSLFSSKLLLVLRIFSFHGHYVYAGNHEKMSMGLVRITFAILYALLFLLLLKIKGWHLTKATLMVGPLGVAIVTLVSLITST